MILHSVGESAEHPLVNSLDKPQLIQWEHECNSACEQNAQTYLFWGGVCLKTDNAKRKVNLNLLTITRWNSNQEITKKLLRKGGATL